MEAGHGVRGSVSRSTLAMKIFILSTLLLSVAFSLTGCGSDSAAKTDPTVVKQRNTNEESH